MRAINLCFLFFLPAICYGMEEEGLESVLMLRKNMDGLKGARNFIRNCDCERLSEDRFSEIKKYTYSLSEGLSGLIPVITREVERRSEQDFVSPAHTEMIAFLSCISSALNTDGESQIGGQLEKLRQHNMEVEDRQAALAHFDASHAKISEVIQKFFGLACNCPTAFRLCLRTTVWPKLMVQFFSNPDLFYRITEQCKDSWYGKNNKLACKLYSGINQELATIVEVLKGDYQRAAVYSSHMKNLQEELKKIGYKHFQGESGCQEEIAELLEKIEACEDCLKLEYDSSRNPLDLRVYRLGAGPMICDDRSTSQDVADGCESSRDVRQEQGEKFFNKMGDILEGLPVLLKKSINCVIFYNFIDDCYSQLVAASENPDFLLADLASRLRVKASSSATFSGGGHESLNQNEGLPINFMELIGFFCNIAHEAFIHGHAAGQYIDMVSPELKEVCQAIDKLVLTMKSVGELGVQKKDDSFWTKKGKNLLSFVLTPERSEQIFQGAFKLDGLGDKLQKKIVPLVTTFLNDLQINVTHQRESVIKLDAITRLLEIHTGKNARTRSMGDGEFRQWFDQLGHTWKNARGLLYRKKLRHTAFNLLLQRLSSQDLPNKDLVSLACTSKEFKDLVMPALIDRKRRAQLVAHLRLYTGGFSS